MRARERIYPSEQRFKPLVHSPQIQRLQGHYIEMAFVLTFAGFLMIVTGVRGTYSEFGAQVASDFTGSQPFTYWVAAIIGVGSIGYIDSLKTLSRLFLTLIMVSMVIANKGFFTQLTAALKAGPIAPQSGTGSPATSQALPAGSAQSMTNADGSAPASATDAKFNQYFNAFSSFFGFGGQPATATQ